MTDEDPLSIVQVRYARGEIDTAEYEEFLSCFLKNIAFQQVPSLKIASERYANGEITIGQYKEILSHLINDISNYEQSTPLRIVHLRYAEGVLETNEFEEKINVLMTDIPLYPHSPPLAVLFNRFAKGEIDITRYKEMLAHLATYCTPTLPKEKTSAPAHVEKTHSPPQKKETPPPVQKPAPAPPSSKPQETPPSPDPYRLNFAAMQSPSSAGIISHGPSTMSDGVPGDLLSLGSTPDVLANQQEIISAPGNITAKSDPYHITDTSSSHVPVTVLVKPEIDTLKDATIPLKKDIPNLIPEDQLMEIQKEEPVVSDIPEQIIKTDADVEEDKVLPDVSVPKSGDHHKIKALIKQGKYQESITRIDELLKKAPDDYRSLFLKSISLFNLGRGDESLDILNRAKKSCTNKEDIKDIERIYNHIVQKGHEKSLKKENGNIRDEEKEGVKERTKTPSPFSHSETVKPYQTETLKKMREQAQGLIDAGNYIGANDTLADIPDLIKEIPLEILQKESIDDLFAAKGFTLYQLKEFCEAKKFFKESTRINPKNETAIHYLNDIRIKDCNKFVRHE